VYFCCLEVLERAGTGVGAGVRATITVREEEDELVFEAVADHVGSDPPFAADAGLRDRVEALGGRLAIRSEPASSIRVSGSVPLSR
jgi:signal transduction histidine kinase